VHETEALAAAFFFFLSYPLLKAGLG
jgi:hypothetical protein